MSIVGSTIDHYRILSRLGEGGMGAVYLAEDVRLGRTVALKLLPEHLAADGEARARLAREARTAAALSHPSICTLHDVGEHEGRVYLVMEHVEGQDLARRLEAGPLPPAEAVRLAVQMAEALGAAHDRGVVHRDVKPGNVMITPTGRAVVMDFGLARRTADTRLTRTGAVMGTVAYMAPEQIRGEPADHRADIWALGSVLYEMLAGRRPFQADHEQAVIYAILNEDPPPLRKLRPELPPELERIVARALARDPRARYQSCRELLADLRPLQARLEAAPAGRDPGAAVRRRRPPPWAILGASALLLGVAVAAVLLLARPREGPIDSLAVLPFANLSGDPGQEYIADGVTETLITELSKIEQLRVISRTSVMQYKEARQPLPDIARRLGVRAIVEGSALRVGDRLRITAQLIDAASDRHLWAEDYDRDYGDLLALQKEVARQIAAQVRIELDPEERALLSGGATATPEVVDEVLQGQQILNALQARRSEEAIAHFERAIALDPDYAHAWTGLATSRLYEALGDLRSSTEALPLARSAARRAIELDDTEAVAHTILGYVSMGLDWDWAGAAGEFRRALEIDPGNAGTRHGYADYLLVMGRPEESLEQVRIALLNDPLSPLTLLPWVGHLMLAGHFEQALREAERIEAENPHLSFRLWRAVSLWLLGWREESLALQRERYAHDEEALKALERGLQAGGPPGAMAALGTLLAGRRRRGDGGEDATIYFAAAGLADSTLAGLERLADRRDISLYHQVANPLIRAFGDDPRYAALLRRLKLPPEAIARLTAY